jgi:tRNA threonylcarbamoyladenosine biosynthesis protein TsaB
MPSGPNLLVLNTAIPPLFALLISDGAPGPVHFMSPESSLSREGMGLVSGALEEAGLGPASVDAFVFVIGPGSFTGIRVGLSMIKGMAFGRQAAAVPVSSLFILSQPFFGKGKNVCPVLDARMDQVYTALFNADGGRLLPDQAVKPADFAANLSGDIILAGEDAARFEAMLKTDSVSSLERVIPSPAQIVEAVVLEGTAKYLRGERVALSDLSPSYLRKSYAEIKAGP